MSTSLKAHLDKFIELEGSAFSDIIPYFEQETFKKKENLIAAGDFCNYQYFVEKGCVRKFFIKENGVEQTTEFALENWWITDNFAFERKSSTSFYIQAVEPVTLLQISHANREALLKAHPVMERYFRFVYQTAYAAAERRIRFLYEFSREDLYLHFSQNYPDFIQRIPQYLLASFLGFTPEYLSEIRGKMRS